MQTAAARILAGTEQPVILDVGANLGQWSLQMVNVLRKGSKGDFAPLRMHAFEPVPDTSEKLTANLVARIRPNGLEAFDGWHAELERFFTVNYALVHRGALGWFTAKNGSFEASNTYA